MLIAFVCINVAMAFINQWIDHSYRWHYWVLTGWGLGLTLSLMADNLLQNKEMSAQTKLFIMHTGLYVLVNLFLVFVNLFDGQGLKVWA